MINECTGENCGPSRFLQCRNKSTTSDHQIRLFCQSTDADDQVHCPKLQQMKDKDLHVRLTIEVKYTVLLEVSRSKIVKKLGFRFPI